MNANDLFTLARTIYGEARGETHRGRVAVGWVIRNRFESGRWFAGATLAKTCTKKWQFSAWNPDDPNRRRMVSLTLDDPLYCECVYAAAAVISGAAIDPTEGACHYINPKHASPPWAEGKTADVVIGAHHFYRGID